MLISSLDITNFRNLSNVNFSPGHELNILCGHNGSGKTNLLEAIYYLGLGRSFRQATLKRIVQHQEDKFSIFSQLVNESEQAISIGIERQISGLNRSRIDHQDILSHADIAYCLPMRIIHAQSHYLFESGPLFRRKYLDWGVFYHAAGFLNCWRQYERVLKQRNSALRNKRSKQELMIWTDELVKYGLMVDQLRREYIDALQPVLIEIATELLSMLQLEIIYHPGWNINQDLVGLFEEGYLDELRCGYTQFGPHRADFDITIDAVSVKHFLSRGQQKLLICAMILAQGILLKKYSKKRLIYLIDDLPSELDEHSKRKLITLLLKQNAQIFVTTIEADTIGNHANIEVPYQVFHVKHGVVTG